MCFFTKIYFSRKINVFINEAQTFAEKVKKCREMNDYLGMRFRIEYKKKETIENRRFLSTLIN
ncbi:MAG: hypothetical protein CMO01_26995 [Thalassobius sp.]|nr:hypothetical protein [Thalassovita sp.]